jgi:hypothetical protein
MAKLSIGFEGQTWQLDIEGRVNEVKLFMASYEHFLTTQAKTPKRFAFRREGEGGARTTNILVDMSKVVWVMVDDERLVPKSETVVLDPETEQARNETARAAHAGDTSTGAARRSAESRSAPHRGTPKHAP